MKITLHKYLYVAASEEGSDGTHESPLTRVVSISTLPLPGLRLILDYGGRDDSLELSLDNTETVCSAHWHEDSGEFCVLVADRHFSNPEELGLAYDWYLSNGWVGGGEEITFEPSPRQGSSQLQ